MGKFTTFTDFENQNQITSKRMILKSECNHFKVGDLRSRS